VAATGLGSGSGDRVGSCQVVPMTHLPLDALQRMIGSRWHAPQGAAVGPQRDAAVFAPMRLDGISVASLPTSVFLATTGLRAGGSTASTVPGCPDSKRATPWSQWRHRDRTESEGEPVRPSLT
jgi:hypothetical protein